MSAKKAPRIPLPKSWAGHVRSAMLHVISLAQFATVYTRSWAVDSLNGRVRLKVENGRLRQELALFEQEMRIKDARMAQINPHRRPHYPPTERMAILELRAARGWTLKQVADAMLLPYFVGTFSPQSSTGEPRPCCTLESINMHASLPFRYAMRVAMSCRPGRYQDRQRCGHENEPAAERIAQF